MFDIIAEWFGQGFNIPVIVCDLFFFWIGIFAALKLKNTKSVIYVMLTAVVLLFAAVLLSKSSSYMFEIYSVFISGIAVLVFAGACIGLIVRSVKKF